LSSKKSIAVLLGIALLALSIVFAACGDDDDSTSSDSTSAESGGAEVTVFSSFPLQGASRPIGEGSQQGIELAFKENDYTAGDVKINFVPLDDSTAQAGAWTPEAESANARKAISDDAVLYLGTFNSGAAAISIPLLNEAGIPQLSPGNTAVGLTTDAPGAEPGAPDIYYPTGERNYARIVPNDTVQGAALATVMSDDGCTAVGMVNDEEVYGAGLSENIETSAADLGLEITSNEGIDPKAANFRSVASNLADQNIDCFIFSGITANGAVQLYKDVAAAVPDAQLYGPDGVAEATFFDPAEGGLPTDVGSRLKITVATLDPDSYGSEGQKFFDAYAEEYGDDDPNPYAIFGYEAGLLAVDMLERAEDPTDPASVKEAMFATENRESILGEYSIDENGDTSLTTYGVYTIEDGQMVFDSSVEGSTDAAE
jgi:branched-chain amino acid transport system substrate-binding protein